MINIKKLICAMMIAALMAGSSIAFAATSPTFPMPILVKVLKAGDIYFDVEVTNTNTGEVMSGRTDKNGEFYAEWANSDDGYARGDTFIIDVSGSQKTFTYNGEPPEIFWFDFTDVEPICPPCDCEQQDLVTLIVAVLVGIGAASGITYKAFKGRLNDADYIDKVPKGTGIKIYKKRNGTNEVLHKHSGIRGYHNPETSHRDVNERHPSGQLFPKYNDTGKYVG